MYGKVNSRFQKLYYWLIRYIYKYREGSSIQNCRHLVEEQRDRLRVFAIWQICNGNFIKPLFLLFQWLRIKSTLCFECFECLDDLSSQTYFRMTSHVYIRPCQTVRRFVQSCPAKFSIKFERRTFLCWTFVHRTVRRNKNIITFTPDTTMLNRPA